MTTSTVDDEAAAFYLYLKARVGERRDLSLREVSRVYREYLLDREEARGAVATGGFLSTSQAARVAGVSPQTIRNWIQAGIVPDVRVTNRKGDLRIPADFMDRLDLGIKGNPEFADSSAYVRAIRDQHEELTDEEYFAMLDRELDSAE